MKDEIIVEKLKQHNVLFFWHTQERLPVLYYQLQESLKHIGIILLPLKEDGFFLLPKSYPWQILAFRYSISVHRELENFRQKCLENSFFSGKIHLLDLSSFTTLKEMQTAEKFFRYKKNSYTHIALPLSVEQIVQEIAVSYFRYSSFIKQDIQKDENQVIWPKMPSLRLQN